MTRDDTLLLVITGSIACQFQDLGGEVLKDSSKVDYEEYTAISIDTCELVESHVPGAPAPTRCA